MHSCLQLLPWDKSARDGDVQESGQQQKQLPTPDDANLAVPLNSRDDFLKRRPQRASGRSSHDEVKMDFKSTKSKLVKAPTKRRSWSADDYDKSSHLSNALFE